MVSGGITVTGQLDGESTAQLTLDNQHEDFLYNDAGTNISGTVYSQAHLWYGSTEVTDEVSWNISDNDGSSWGTSVNTNATASISNSGASKGLLTVTGLIANSVKIKVRASYGNNYYYADFTANKTSQDKYDLVMKPNTIAYNSEDWPQAGVTVQATVKRTDFQGNQSTPNIDVNGTIVAGHLYLFWSWVSNGGSIGTPQDLQATSKTITLSQASTYAGIYFELRLYDDATDLTKYRLCDYETVDMTIVENGADGTKYQRIYRSLNIYPCPSEDYPSGNNPTGWSTTPTAISESTRYRYLSERSSDDGGTTWTGWSTPVLDAYFSEDGKSISIKGSAIAVSNSSSVPGSIGQQTNDIVLMNGTYSSADTVYWNGSSWTNGLPGGETAAVGDGFILTSSGHLYILKNGNHGVGRWEDVGQIQGPAGPSIRNVQAFKRFTSTPSSSDKPTASTITDSTVDVGNGWSLTPPAEDGVISSIDYSNVSAWMSGNVITIPSPGNSGSNCGTITFVTSKANTDIMIRLTASSEANYDFGAIGLLDQNDLANASASDIKSDNGTICAAKVSGTQTTDVTLRALTAGTHSFQIAYAKDGSSSTGNDNATVKVLTAIGKSDIYCSTAAFKDGAIMLAWSDPVKWSGSDGENGEDGEPAVSYEIRVASSSLMVSPNGEFSGGLTWRVIKHTGLSETNASDGTAYFELIGNGWTDTAQVVTPSSNIYSIGSFLVGKNWKTYPSSTYNRATGIRVFYEVNYEERATLTATFTIQGQMYRNPWYAGKYSQLVADGFVFTIDDYSTIYFTDDRDGGNNRKWVWVGNNISNALFENYVPSVANMSNDANWELMTTEFKYIISEAIFSNFANFGGSVFNGGYQFSQYGYMRGFGGLLREIGVGDTPQYQYVDPEDMFGEKDMNDNSHGDLIWNTNQSYSVESSSWQQVATLSFSASSGRWYTISISGFLIRLADVCTPSAVMSWRVAMDSSHVVASGEIGSCDPNNVLRNASIANFYVATSGTYYLQAKVANSSYYRGSVSIVKMRLCEFVPKYVVEMATGRATVGSMPGKDIRHNMVIATSSNSTIRVEREDIVNIEEGNNTLSVVLPAPSSSLEGRSVEVLNPSGRTVVYSWERTNEMFDNTGQSAMVYPEFSYAAGSNFALPYGGSGVTAKQVRFLCHNSKWYVIWTDGTFVPHGPVMVEYTKERRQVC